VYEWDCEKWPSKVVLRWLICVSLVTWQLKIPYHSLGLYLAEHQAPVHLGYVVKLNVCRKLAAFCRFGHTIIVLVTVKVCDSVGKQVFRYNGGPTVHICQLATIQANS